MPSTHSTTATLTSGDSSSLDPLETSLHDHPTPSISPHRIPKDAPRLFRHSGWWPDRERVYTAMVTTDQTQARRDRFTDCGRDAHVMRSVEDPAKYRIMGSGCRDRFCVPCANERSSRIAANAVDLCRGKQIKFVTLTVKTDGLDLGQAIAKLQRGLTALRRSVLWKQAVKGGAAFLEVKRSRNHSRWHPHLHCIIESTWIDQRELAATWLSITGDSHVVDIRACTDNRKVARYVTKYASKPFNSETLRCHRCLHELMETIAGTRLCRTFGSWRGTLLASRVPEGTWEYVCTLRELLEAARLHGSTAWQIATSLADAEATLPIEQYVPEPQPPPSDLPPVFQRDFFGTWDADGSYRHHYDHYADHRKDL